MLAYLSPNFHRSGMLPPAQKFFNLFFNHFTAANRTLAKRDHFFASFFANQSNARGRDKQLSKRPTGFLC
jgi:hypothetical protein